MPNLAYLSVEKTQRFTRTLVLPFLPHLRYVDIIDAPRIKAIQMDFVSGDGFVPDVKGRLPTFVRTDQCHLLGREANYHVTIEACSMLCAPVAPSL